MSNQKPLTPSEKRLEEVRILALYRVDKYQHQVVLSNQDFLIEQCESPIEKLLAVALDHFIGISGHMYIKTKFPLGDDELLPVEARLRTQAELLNGRYRADFALEAFPVHRPLSSDAALATVCVEADGHDWHERTPEQAERDKKRDREFTTAGLTVVRFTGREIYRDPFQCAHQALAILYAKAGEADWRPYVEATLRKVDA